MALLTTKKIGTFERLSLEEGSVRTRDVRNSQNGIHFAIASRAKGVFYV